MSQVGGGMDENIYGDIDSKTLILTFIKKDDLLINKVILFVYEMQDFS